MYELLQVNKLYIVPQTQFSGNISTFRHLRYTHFAYHICKNKTFRTSTYGPSHKQSSAYFLNYDWPKVKFKCSCILHMHYAKCVHS